MSFSRIDPQIVDLEAATTGSSELTGPLVAAWSRLAAARGEPLSGANVEAWVASLRSAATDAIRAIRAHIGAAERPDSWPRRIRGRRERPHVVEAQAEEHRQLLREAEQLEAMAREARAAGPGLGIRLSEQSVLLEIALARHVNRLGAMLAARPPVDGRAYAGGGR
jgi:hypothetical protein